MRADFRVWHFSDKSDMSPVMRRKAHIGGTIKGRSRRLFADDVT